MDDWESRDFEQEELPKPSVLPVRTDRWEGEDEEEPLKDNWDDEEEVKAANNTGAPATQVKKKKNKLAEAIAEKERKAEEQRLEKVRANMTPEERAADKMKQMKLQEEAELQMVKSTFGPAEVDISDPMTKDDFDALRKKIIGDLRKFEKRAPFEDFVEDFIQDLCLSLPSKRLKKVKTNVEALYFEKNKQEKAALTGGGKGKGKSTAKPKLTKESDLTNVEVGYEVDEFDDFM